MRRRKLIVAGATIALGTTAGCLGGDGEGAETTTAPGSGDGGTTQPGQETPGEPEAGAVSFSVEHSGTEMQWGEEYSVTVTARAGEDPPDVATGLIYQAEDDSDWSGSFGNTETMWRLDAGKSQTETFEIQPPGAGEYTIGLMESTEESVVEEWELVVLPPTAAFGEPISYYDGLDVTIDVELHEWMDFELDYDGESGINSVRPEAGQWVKVTIVAENTNMNTDVGIPGYGEFTALAGNSPLEHPRYLGAGVGGDTRFEVDNQTIHDLDPNAWLEMNDGGEPGQEGFWIVQDDLVPGAVKEGWVVFETDTDTTKEDLQIRLRRNDIRATWE